MAIKTIKKTTSFKGLINEEYEEVRVGDIDYWKEEDESVYDNIIAKFKETNLDYDWWDSIYEDFMDDMEKKYGWAPDADDISFSGFWSQGDGASFTGTLYQDDVAKIMSKIYKKFPLNKGFEDGNLDVEISLERHGRYVHEKSVSANVDTLESVDYEEFFELYKKELQQGELKGVKEYDEDECDDAIYDYIDGFTQELEESINDWAEESAVELYKRLETTYDELNSDEAVLDTIRANDYEFDEFGNIA